MRKKVLNISDFDVSVHPVIYTCYGLGSCIGLFISDRVNHISGAAHIPVPASLGGSAFLGANYIIVEMLNLFKINGSDLKCLRAKVTGGSEVYKITHSIGSENIKEVMAQLVNNKIFIAAKDVGGNIARTARYNTLTGDLEISSENKTYSI